MLLTYVTANTLTAVLIILEEDLAASVLRVQFTVVWKEVQMKL